MSIQSNKNKTTALTMDSLLDRLIDGKIVDTGEMYDRLMLSQQLNIMLSISAKQAPKRVR
jgi:hypothetical protein